MLNRIKTSISPLSLPLYRDKKTMQIAVYGEPLVCLALILPAIQLTWLLIVLGTIALLNAIRIILFLKYGGVSFNQAKTKLRIVNYYRIYNFDTQNIEEFITLPYGGVLSLLGNLAAIKIKGKKNPIKIMSIVQPTHKKYNQQYKEINQLLDSLNQQLHQN